MDRILILIAAIAAAVTVLGFIAMVIPRLAPPGGCTLALQPVPLEQLVDSILGQLRIEPSAPSYEIDKELMLKFFLKNFPVTTVEDKVTATKAVV